jgi:hypothetical protein
MVFDKKTAAAELDENAESIRGYLGDDDDLVEQYREAFVEVSTWDSARIRNADELTREPYPGAVPPQSDATFTPQFDTLGTLLCEHTESESWTSHETVNDWARDILRGVPMLATDGSEIPPTTQFNVPVAYVQAAWCLNHHVPDGRLDRDLVGDLLTPTQLSREADGGDYRFVDSSLVGQYRYEHEGRVVVERMEALAADRDAGELERPPIVLYDGPLVLSFTSTLDRETRKRYIETMRDIVAASQELHVPLVGYVAGTDATDLAKLVQLLRPESFDDDRLIPDARVLSGLMGTWGDRTVPFVCRRSDGSVDDLARTDENSQYRFSGEVLFSYLNVPPGAGLDRIEFPDWLVYEDGPEEYPTMYDYTVEMIRAEAAVGRGYPELLQQADSDAVLDQRDRQQFHRLIQNWAEENDIALEWDAKALSKELRRR